ncbi:SRPBCC family protein [Glycomyces dulcitolivorans]|uniref:SRPBCC family protein n=1 Tax=Glycomyces dulcitolivorans TaxID=2200759 RepID=UPI000DD37803|nr:carbon monoxide dehydrogenase subunit G [Glycomyces dulcitolivorans]
MKVSGTALINAPRGTVWDALQDPAVLVRTIPGCKTLEQTGPDHYKATVEAGVASIKGLFDGVVELCDPEPQERIVLKSSGKGAPGTVSATVLVSLTDEAGATRIDYDADAVVGGMIGGVGQRMLTSVGKKTAGEFFAAVEKDLVEGPTIVASEPVAAGDAPQVFTRAAAPAGARPGLGWIFAAFALGAVTALLGVLVGRL